MKRPLIRAWRRRILTSLTAASACFAQTVPLTWQQIKNKFEAANPTLQAGKDSIAESRAAEVTAFLRPNPTATATLDQFSIFKPQLSPSGSGDSVYRPLANIFPYLAVSYLHERQHKRELRLESAKKTTEVTASGVQDLERGLIFNLRAAFVNALQAKAVLVNAKENLAYWDRELGISRTRLQAGDMAQLDLDRMELQRVQFESDYENAVVNLRTSKVQLLLLLNDRTQIDKFDIDGPFDFSEALAPLDEFRNQALAARPDLQAAKQTVDLARTNHTLAIANGTADPTFSFDIARNPPIPAYFGFSVSIPVRIFDKNQGEKERTRLDIGRSQRLVEAATSQVFGDVDSAYWTLIQAVNLLKPYKSRYLPLSAQVRDRVSFAYQHGGASLLDFLDAEKSYRDTRLAYLNLIGSYLTAAAQMNMAAGREVLQ